VAWSMRCCKRGDVTRCPCWCGLLVCTVLFTFSSLPMCIPSLHTTVPCTTVPPCRVYRTSSAIERKRSRLHLPTSLGVPQISGAPHAESSARRTRLETATRGAVAASLKAHDVPNSPGHDSNTSPSGARARGRGHGHGHEAAARTRHGRNKGAARKKDHADKASAGATGHSKQQQQQHHHHHHQPRPRLVPGQIPQDDQEAFQAVVAAEMAGNFDMMFDLTLKMRDMLSLSERLGMGHQLSEALDILEQEMRKTLQVRRASVFTYDATTKELVLQMGTGYPKQVSAPPGPGHDHTIRYVRGRTTSSCGRLYWWWCWWCWWCWWWWCWCWWWWWCRRLLSSALVLGWRNVLHVFEYAVHACQPPSVCVDRRLHASLFCSLSCDCMAASRRIVVSVATPSNTTRWST